MKTIYFVGNNLNLKKDKGGLGAGEQVLLRHFIRFRAEGIKVILINTGTYKNDFGFEEINLPKKWWYPPLRKLTPWLTQLRINIIYKVLIKKIQSNEPAAVLSLLGEYSNLLAYKISKKKRLNLYMIYHDDSVFNYFKKYRLLSDHQLRIIIKATAYFFPVSKPMAELLEANGAKAHTLIYPIPEQGSFVGQKFENVNFSELRIGNSGLIFNDLHLEIIENIVKAAKVVNAHLQLITTLPKKLSAHIYSFGNNVKVIERFDTVTELLNYLSNQTDVLLVFYSFKLDKEFRMFTSFPSKFVEYCKLGLPIIIIAPPESSIGKWAVENNWLTYENTGEPAKIATLIGKLNNRDFWNSARLQAQKYADTDFDPDEIHRKLSNSIKYK